MLSYFLIGITAFLVSGITLFSGFGLGTALMPVFAVFFPIETAVAATAIVHLANNIFKGILTGRHADLKITFMFSIPAAAAAFLGAFVLYNLTSPEPLFTYTISGHEFKITAIKIVIGSLMALFSFFELNSTMSEKSFDKKLIPAGGLISGFFGGLSGHQGAFRSAFLLKAGLSKEAFIGTTVLSAIIVDAVRISVYGFTFISRDINLLSEMNITGHIAVGIISAFAGIFIGSRLIQKVTYRSIQILVGSMLLLIAAALISGII